MSYIVSDIFYNTNPICDLFFYGDFKAFYGFNSNNTMLITFLFVLGNVRANKGYLKQWGVPAESRPGFRELSHAKKRASQPFGLQSLTHATLYDKKLRTCQKVLAEQKKIPRRKTEGLCPTP